MNLNPRFETIWDRIDDFAVPEEAIKWCPYARKFAEWAATLISTSEQPNLIEVNQAKVLLLDRYFEWRSHVPKSHRSRVEACSTI